MAVTPLLCVDAYRQFLSPSSVPEDAARPVPKSELEMYESFPV